MKSNTNISMRVDISIRVSISDSNFIRSVVAHIKNVPYAFSTLNNRDSSSLKPPLHRFLNMFPGNESFFFFALIIFRRIPHLALI